MLDTVAVSSVRGQDTEGDQKDGRERERQENYWVVNAWCRWRLGLVDREGKRKGMCWWQQRTASRWHKKGREAHERSEAWGRAQTDAYGCTWNCSLLGGWTSGGSSYRSFRSSCQCSGT